MAQLTLAQNPWEQTLLARTEFLAAPPQLQLEYLCQFGIVAPTSHNSVPQRFKILPEQTAIELVLDRKFVLAYSDRVGRQAAVSMGCVVESIALAAEWYGWQTNCEYVPVTPTSVYPHVAGQERFAPVARLTFTNIADAVEADREWPRLLLERKVIRSEYDRTQVIPEAVLQHITLGTEQRFPAVQLHLITGTLSLRAFGKFQENADRFVMENQQFAHELGEWLLPNDETSTPYAMRGVEFGFDDAFAQTVHNGLLGKQRLLPDQVAAFAKGGKVGVESSAAVAVLTVAKDDQASRLEAGRAYLWAALELWHAGFATAVHAGITEVDWVTTMFAASMLHTSRRPEMVFRIGKPKREADWQRPHAKRPALADLMVSPH